MEYVVTAAGGNATAIETTDGPHERGWYESEGCALMERTRGFEPEQAGFLDVEGGHFEMSGGEFCGNAARSAAMLLAILTDRRSFTFTMSGYEGPVMAEVELHGDNAADVACSFPNMHPQARWRSLHYETSVQVVDLGGIVHVLLEGALPADYQMRHRQVTTDLGFEGRPAVGVNWIVREGDRVTLHPVVWVRAVDTFFYETACGSGSIAAAAATGVQEITQPTGESIHVKIGPEGVRLSSRMKVVHVA